MIKEKIVMIQNADICNEFVSGQPERLNNHIKRCKNVDENIKSGCNNSIYSFNQNVQIIPNKQN